MPIPFAINGLGRIGRALLRVTARNPLLELVALNDLAPPETLARLIRHDSVHGPFVENVEARGDCLWIDGRRVRVFNEDKTSQVPWPKTSTKLVVEASGQATTRALAAGHLRGNVKKVVISALSLDSDLSLCLGINTDSYDPKHHDIISNTSCTTNCLALLVKVLDQNFGLERALMNEVHSYTSNQQLVDGIHNDPRRGRAATMNIIPTTTGAPAAVESLMPHLAGRLQGQAVRVPTPNVALLDLTVNLTRSADPAQINAAFCDAAKGNLAGLLAVSNEPLVSTDHVGAAPSAVVDLLLTQSAGDNLHRVMAWYDNEWGYANRLAELLTLIGERLS